MVEQPTFASRRTTTLYFAAEPFVVIDQTGQQVKRDLIDIAAPLRGEATEPGFEFWRDVQVHERMVANPRL